MRMKKGGTRSTHTQKTQILKNGKTPSRNPQGLALNFTWQPYFLLGKGDPSLNSSSFSSTLWMAQATTSVSGDDVTLAFPSRKK